MQSRSINESMRILHTRKEESEHIEKKCGCRKDFIDLEARNSFQMGKVTAPMIKCIYGHNHHGLRDAGINDYVVEAQCPRCKQVKTWCHVIKCRETRSLRKEFVKDLAATLVKNKPEDVNVEIAMSFAEGIMRYAENEEEEEYETNQQCVGMKELFRGHVAIDWEGANLNTIKH